ncbi:DUF664 domain-containing protein [Streptomyces sp. NPDC059637]
MIDEFAKDNLHGRLRRDREALLWKLDGLSDLWATEDETRDQIIGFYRRTWEHSDATITALPLDAPGHVPWWPEPCPNTNLFAVMVHVLGESIRHAGHADILREGLDGRTGLRAEHEKQIDDEARAAYCAKIEQAARSAAPIKAY